MIRNTETAPDPTEIALSDADILDAMRAIPGYLDISTEDFRTLYHFAHRHALERLFGGLTAGRMMRVDITPLTPELTFAEALRAFAAQQLRTLPVVDPEQHVIGVLTETDVLRTLGVTRLLDWIAHQIEQPTALNPHLLARPVSALMTAPAICVPTTAGVHEIFAAFTRHPGRAMPVLGADGRLAGVLRRKDVLHAAHLEGLA